MTEHPANELLARLVEGEDDPATTAHVKVCSECRAQVESARKLESLLASYAPASRNLCPPRELLASRPREIEAHLEVCPLCREDLRDLTALETAPLPVLAVRFVQGLVELVENALGELLPAAEPALARGGTTGTTVSVKRELGPGETLEVTLAPGREGVDVLVRLEGVPRFRVALVRAGKVLEGRESTDGRVLLDGVAPGDYDLVVHRSGQPQFELRLGVKSP
jgi:hypothetical protein